MSIDTEHTFSNQSRGTTHLGPIARTLLRSKLGASLIVLQVALTVAILANVLPVVWERVQKVTRVSGVDDQQLFAIVVVDPNPKTDTLQRLAAEREAILGVPGVAAAGFSNTFPNSGGGWSSTATTKPDTDGKNMALYFASAELDKAYDLKLLAGRWFDASEIQSLPAGVSPTPKQAVLTKSSADSLFPGESAIGKRFAIDDSEQLDIEVIGVVNDVSRPWVNFGESYYHSLFLPAVPAGFGQWIVRAKEKTDVGALALAVQTALAKADRSRVYDSISRFDATRTQAYSSDLVLCWLLAGFALLLVAVTALGIVGLASFWVTQRTPMIGVRRALGARARDIGWYFRQENLLLSGAGALIGIGLAYALNFLLTSALGGNQLPLWPVALGAASMILLGQIAVTHPARRAAHIPPAIATRSA